MPNSAKKPWNVVIALHILAWVLNAANLLLPPLFAPKQPGAFEDAGQLQGIIIIGCTHLIMQLMVFYTNYFLVFDRFFLAKSRSYYFIVSLVVVVGFWFVENQIFQYDLFHLRPSISGAQPVHHKPYPDFLLPLITAYFASFLVKLYPLYIAQQVKEVQLVSQKQSIQLNLLKGQMQPHFLFNTLNNLRYLLRSAPEKADTAILQLSDLLRYTVYSSGTEKVSIDEEVAYLMNYIALQKMRLPQDIEVDVKLTMEAPEKQIAPLLLIPFIENAFKYGISAIDPGYIIIEIKAQKNGFYFMVNNRNYKNKAQGGTAIGIANVKERLAYLYPNQHKLDITFNDMDFTVKLQIDLG